MTRSARARLGVVAAAAVLLAGAPARAQFGADWLRNALTPVRPGLRPGPSRAIYPPQVISLRFSHREHMAADVSCEVCHDAVDRSTRPTDRNIPGHEQCESCHEIEEARAGEATDPLSTCVACHPGHVAGTEAVAANDFPPANLRFAHEPHLKRGAKCADCHLGVPEAELATRAQLPRMVTCLSCHDGRQAPNRCQTCHLTEPDGLLRTRFAAGTLAPSGTLRDDDHGRDFLRRHANVARSDLESCSSCHRAAECEGCHAASSKAFRIHPPDWTQTHAVSARGMEMDCQSCHRQQEFCLSCHQQLGVAAESPFRVRGSPRPLADFHPPGFIAAVRGGPEHHAWAAQANIQSCAGCHQEQTCLKCHASPTAAPTASGFNPHPVGFLASGRACQALRGSVVACAKCHGNGVGPTTLGQLLVQCE